MSFINISKRGLKFSEKSLFEIDIVFDEKVTFGNPTERGPKRSPTHQKNAKKRCFGGVIKTVSQNPKICSKMDRFGYLEK